MLEKCVCCGNPALWLLQLHEPPAPPAAVCPECSGPLKHNRVYNRMLPEDLPRLKAMLQKASRRPKRPPGTREPLGVLLEVTA